MFVDTDIYVSCTKEYHKGAIENIGQGIDEHLRYHCQVNVSQSDYPSELRYVGQPHHPDHVLSYKPWTYEQLKRAKETGLTYMTGMPKYSRLLPENDPDTALDPRFKIENED